MKARWSLSAFAVLAVTFFAACAVEEDGGLDEELAAPATATASSAVGPAWYYTCSDALLACSPGYGAVEWVYYPDCIPYGASHRVKCVRGAIDP